MSSLVTRSNESNNGNCRNIAEQPTSIGTIGRLRLDSWNRRVKGLVLVETLDDVNRVLRDGAEQIMCHRKNRDSPTRLTVRFILPSDIPVLMYPALFQRGPLSDMFADGWTGGIEGVFTLNSVLPGRSLVYFGFNAPRRYEDLQVLRAEIESIEVVRKMEVPPAEVFYERARAGGFHLEVLTDATPNEIRRITQLYQQAFTKYVFPINEESVTEIIKNLTLVARDSTGRIVSSLVAERALLPADRNINFIEVSEAATDQSCRGNGLLTALYCRMVELLRQHYASGDTIVYAEARAPWIPASVVTRRGLGQYCGLLRKHCTIVSVRNENMQDNSDLEDLTLWLHPSF